MSPGSRRPELTQSGSSARSRSRSRGALVFEFERDGEATRVKLRQDVDPSDPQSIERVETTARKYVDKIPEGPLPGSGQLGDTCGDSIPALLCSSRGCGEVYEPGKTCRRSRCPRCWQSWDFQRAVERAAQLESLGRTRYSNGQKVKQHHVTVSFRPSTRFNSKDPLDRAIEAVKRLCHEVGMDTGVIIYHPYRIAEAYRGDVRGHESGDGDMTWADVLGKVEDEKWPWPAVRDELLVYEPHFHVLGLSEFVDGGWLTEDIEEQTGVVIHRTTADDSSISINDLNDLCRTMAYSVSHAMLYSGEGDEQWQSVIRPFGEVANFSAYDNVKAETKATMRKVAPDVLGVEFPEPRCSAERACINHRDHDDGFSHAHGGVEATSDRDDGDADTNTVVTGDTSDSWTAGADHVPAFVQDPSEAKAEDLERCEGRLIPMWAVDEYIEDDDWMASLAPQQREHVREKRREWVELGRPKPEDVPVTEDGTSPAD